MRFVLVFAALLASPLSLQAITVETVPVGNPGNPDDVLPTRESGSVTYSYRIGKYEVTNSQYVEFLNLVDPAGANPLGLYNSLMNSNALGGIVSNAAAPSGAKYTVKAGRANNPVAFVSWFDAARFANWMHNGQGNGGTETGSYALDGGTPTPTNGDFVTRNPFATWCLPSEDEWYKAAYHKNDGITGNYWDYPNATDTPPFSDQPPGSGAPNQANAANFFKSDGLSNGYDDGYAVTGSTALVGSTNYLTDVGAYPLSHSAYSTFGQAGNVWEWNESLILEQRRVAGGAWFNESTFLASSANNSSDATTEAFSIGFRLALLMPPVLTGDYNHDGRVNAADYTTWRNSLGRSGAGLAADGNNNGQIDSGDYTVWKMHFGEPNSGNASGDNVPESTTACLLVLAVLNLLATSRQLVAGARIR